MRYAYVFERHGGYFEAIVAVYDGSIDTPVFEKKFKSSNDAMAFLSNAGWVFVSNLDFPGDNNQPRTVSRWVRRQSDHRYSPFVAVPAGQHLDVWMPINTEKVYEVEVEGSVLFVLAISFVSDDDTGHVFGYMTHSSELVQEGCPYPIAVLPRYTDPVLSMISPPGLKIGCIGYWFSAAQALESGVQYFDQLRKIYGEVFDEALRANVLRNHTRDTVGGDR